jgi:hypothetical protein
MIWSSATLYPASAREMRSTWFQNWLQKPNDNTPEHILNFHTSKHGDDEKTDVVMQREGGLQTLSVSQIVVENEKTSFEYKDWITKINTNCIIL